MLMSGKHFYDIWDKSLHRERETGPGLSVKESRTGNLRNLRRLNVWAVT